MFALRKPISVHRKVLLAKVPIFGYYYKTFNVLVDRSNLRNTYHAYQQAGKKLKEGKKSSDLSRGWNSKEETRLFRFKNGPFRLAVEEQVSIIPITFADNKRLFPISYFEEKPGVARITIHQEISTKGMNEKNIGRTQNEGISNHRI